MSNARLLGAYDDSPLLTPFVDPLGLERPSKEDILAAAAVHAVLIHPKSHLMADWAIEALEAGKAVLCEKPAGRGSGDTARIVEAVERTGGLFQVGYCWRYAPSVDKMQEVLKTGRLGKVLQVRAHAGCSHGEARTDHMRRPGDIGGAMFVIGCHTIDRILLHFGMPESVVPAQDPSWCLTRMSAVPQVSLKDRLIYYFDILGERFAMKQARA